MLGVDHPPSVLVVVCLGLLIPGLPSLWMKKYVAGITLLGLIPVSFAFFGPIWDLYLFDGTRFDQDGLYPFICCFIATPLLSVIHALVVRRRVLLQSAGPAEIPPKVLQ